MRNHNTIVKRKNSVIWIIELISIIIPSVLTLLIINSFTEIVPLKIQVLPIIMPILFCPIGELLGFISYKKYRDKLSLVGIVFNIVLFLFSAFYPIIAVFLFGV
ncbi:hypothetical protein ABES25_05680 [Bacillus gobiensis]|uniref:hypothetical protein n=1 Tax=Bacillus gobiensis TaxID=1441095 RepID=UPI003D1C790F